MTEHINTDPSWTDFTSIAIYAIPREHNQLLQDVKIQALQKYHAELEEVLLAVVAAGVPLSQIIVGNYKIEQPFFNEFVVTGGIEYV